MPGIAEGLFFHIRHIGKGAEDAAQTVGVKCFQWAHPIELHQLRLRERRTGDHFAVFHVAGRTGIFLDDVDRGKPRLVLEGPFTDHRQAAHEAFKSRYLIPLSRGIAQDDIAAPRRDAAVDDGGETLGFRQCIEQEAILVEETDIHESLSGLQYRCRSREAHEARHRTHHDVRIRDRAFDAFGCGEIRLADGQPEGLQASEGHRRFIRHRNPKFRSQITRHRPAHPSRA